MADVQLFAISMFAPPVHQDFVIRWRITNAPVNLWRYIVNPAIFHPQHHIGIQVVVAGDARFCIGTVQWVAVLVAPYAKGTNAEFDVGFVFFDGF